MRIPVAIYPFEAAMLPAIKYFHQLQDKYQLTRLITLTGTGLAGRDAAYACNDSDIGIPVTDMVDVADPEWEALILIRPIDEEIMNCLEIKDTVEMLLNAGKRVLYYDYPEGPVKNFLPDFTDLLSKGMECYPESKIISASQQADGYYATFDVPVIMVGGLVGNTDTSDVLYSLDIRFRKDGWSPLTIANHPVGGLFGFHNLHSILHSKDNTEDGKILNCNLWVRNWIQMEQPDIILLEAPDAVMKFNDFATNGFGIHTYMVSQALCPDYFVCCMSCELATEDMVKILSQDFSIRMGTPIHAVHANNIIIDGASMVQTRLVSYAYTDRNTVAKQVKKQSHSQIPVFDVISDDGEGLYTHMLNVLEGGI